MVTPGSEMVISHFQDVLHIKFHTAMCARCLVLWQLFSFIGNCEIFFFSVNCCQLFPRSFKIFSSVFTWKRKKEQDWRKSTNVKSTHACKRLSACSTLKHERLVTDHVNDRKQDENAKHHNDTTLLSVFRKWLKLNEWISLDESHMVILWSNFTWELKNSIF